MKKIFFSLVILTSLGFLWFKAIQYSKTKTEQVAGVSSEQKAPKREILKFALVADSENDNDNLKKALSQAKADGSGFVIGLGDWSSIGTEAQLTSVKKIFDDSGLSYYLTPGDHDLWDSRDKQSLRSSTASAGLKGFEALTNYENVFGNPSAEFQKKGVDFVIVDNSDIYKGISDEEWRTLNSELETRNTKLTFVFAHKTPFHPQSEHVMGEGSETITKQAQDFMALMEEKKVDGFFSGDLHFFAEFKSPTQTVKITTIGAVDADRNFQGPRFTEVTVWDDYTWEVNDVEIK